MENDFMQLSDPTFLQELYELLTQGARSGAEKDEPEGVRYIMLSDTLALALAERVRVLMRKIHG